MRHQKAGRKFSRTSAHRQAMFSNMAASLIKPVSYTHLDVYKRQVQGGSGSCGLAGRHQ